MSQVGNNSGAGGGDGGPPQLSPESFPVFREGISLVLSRWTALAIAIENEWGGRDSRQKAERLAADIFSWFTLTRGQLYIDDLEELLVEGMVALNTELDDGSIEEVAEELMIMHEEFSKGDYSMTIRFREENRQGVARPHVTRVGSNDDSDEEEDDTMEGDDSSNMLIDVPETRPTQNSTNKPADVPQPDNSAEVKDGWTTVPPRRQKGKRN